TAALRNPLKHQLECSNGDFRATAGGRFLDGSLQHRKDNWDVVELHIGAHDAGRLRCVEWVGKQSQHAFPQVPQVALALRGSAQYAEEPRRARLFQNELLDQMAERPRITGVQRRQVVDVLQTL